MLRVVPCPSRRPISPELDRQPVVARCDAANENRRRPCGRRRRHDYFLSSLTSVNSASTTSSLRRTAAAACAAGVGRRPAARLRRRVQRLRRFLQLLDLGFDLRPCRRPSSPFPDRTTRPRRGRSIARHLAAVLLDRAARRVHSCVGLVARRRPARGTSCPLRLFASASRTIRWISSSDRPEPALISIFCSLPVFLSLARHVQDAVRVDVEGDFDLRHAARRRRRCRPGRTCASDLL